MDQVVKRTQSAPQNTVQTNSSPAHRRVSRKLGGKGPIAAIIILVVVVLAIVGQQMMARQNSFAQDVQKDKFQAVFLTNGQVYFGKINKLNRNGYTLGNIYYLQVQNGVQPDTQTPATNKDQNLSLAKLGSELHGPEDAMYIEAKQVLFWENLKNDSKVVKAIQNTQK